MESPTTSSSSDHHWKRGSCIGRGSFATVHIATSSNNRTFAVKSTPLLLNSNQLNSLNSEIQILRKLHSNSKNTSPYIIQYLGNDTTSSPRGTSFRNLHLEYLPNGTVSEQSNKTEHLVRSYTRCLVAALTHLHLRNIVHCDIKARNILVGGKYGECKLADFGSAFEIGTKSLKVLPRGSPLWMAPEVLKGEYQGPESDVWSLGCTVIEMMTGEVNRCGGGGTIWQIAFEEKSPAIPAGISDEGRDFLEKCLRRDRTERWSCAELMKHPFVAEIGFDSSLTSLTWSNTPRCVLDEFDDMGSSSESEVASFGGYSSIEKLCCGGGVAEWNDDEDGWMTVRRTIPVYSVSLTAVVEIETKKELEGLHCNLKYVKGLKCNLEFTASTWMKDGSGCRSVCGYELKHVFGGLLLLWSFSVMWLLLITILFDNYCCFRCCYCLLMTNYYWISCIDYSK